jgi:hypothetical protein
MWICRRDPIQFSVAAPTAAAAPAAPGWLIAQTAMKHRRASSIARWIRRRDSRFSSAWLRQPQRRFGTLTGPAHRANRNAASPRVVDRHVDAPAGIPILFSLAAQPAAAAVALWNSHRAGSSRESQ